MDIIVVQGLKQLEDGKIAEVELELSLDPVTGTIKGKIITEGVAQTVPDMD